METKVFWSKSAANTLQIGGIIIGICVISWTIVGNAFTIYGLIRFKPPRSCTGSERRRRITFHYLLSNAIADLLIGLVITPLALYQETIGWPLQVPCAAWIALDVTCCTASCLSLMIISLDRWFTCVHPIAPKWYTDHKAAYVILVIWVVSLTLSTVTSTSVMLSDDIYVTRNHTGFTEVFEQTECIASFSPLYTLTSATISFVLPGLLIVVSNIGITIVGFQLAARDRMRVISSPAGLMQRKQIRLMEEKTSPTRYKKLKTSADAQKNLLRMSTAYKGPGASECPRPPTINPQDKSRREIRLTKTCSRISMCFVMCWFPFVILHCVRSFIGFKNFDFFFYLSIWLGWLNSAINPIIYYSNNEHLSRLKRFLRRLFARCSKTPFRKLLALNSKKPSVSAPDGKVATTTSSVSGDSPKYWLTVASHYIPQPTHMG